MDRDRRSAFLILKAIEEDQSWSNLTVAKQFSKETPLSPAFVREIVYGVLRNQTLLDYNIAKYLKNPKLKIKERILLRMGFYQLAFMDVKAYAAINETVLLAKSLMPGREGFINAVLRSFQKKNCELEYSDSKDCITNYSVNYSCDSSIVKLIINAYGTDSAEEILKQFCKPAPFTIRVNTLKISKEELSNKLLAEGFELCNGRAKTCLYVKGSGLLDSKLYKHGYFSVQGDASQLCIEILAPKPNEIMFDLCAAPGGKSCAAAEMMNNEGEIYAYDLYEHRVELIKKEAKRLGINIIKAETFDSTKLLDKKADCVLCDVPCSGLGTIRRNPELKLKALDISDLPSIQEKILQNASLYARDRIVYSTCTINPVENEKQIELFLSRNAEWKLDKEIKLLPLENGPDGFYIALLKRK